VISSAGENTKREYQERIIPNPVSQVSFNERLVLQATVMLD